MFLLKQYNCGDVKEGTHKLYETIIVVVAIVWLHINGFSCVAS